MILLHWSRDRSRFAHQEDLTLFHGDGKALVEDKRHCLDYGVEVRYFVLKEYKGDER